MTARIRFYGNLSAVALLALVSCGSSGITNAEAPANTDPRKNWVEVFAGEGQNDHVIDKRCDGSTLVYVYYGWGSNRGGTSVIPDSPECK